jgi:hypothetical protein
MPVKPLTTWRVFGALALLAAALVLGSCSARSGAGETAAQAAAGASRQAEPPPILPTPTPPAAAATEQPETASLLPTPTPTGAVEQAAGQADIPAGDPPLLLDLPALVIRYDAEGVPSIGDSTPLRDLGALLPAALINQLTLDAVTIQAAAAAGIQHVMVSNTPSGLRILVNGQPLPAVVWDQQSLDNLLALLGPVEGSLPAALRDLLGTLTNLGVGLVVQLPPGDAPAIPLIVTGAQSNAAQTQANQAAFLARAGAAPVVQIPVYYTEDGAWSVQGITDTEWQALTGLPFGYVRLNPELLRNAAAAGIEQVVVWTDADGIHLTLGSQELPYLRWADGGIHTLVDLLLRLGVIQDAASDQEALDLLLDQWLPALQGTNLRIVVHFPPE